MTKLYIKRLKAIIKQLTGLKPPGDYNRNWWDSNCMCEFNGECDDCPLEEVGTTEMERYAFGCDCDIEESPWYRLQRAYEDMQYDEFIDTRDEILEFLNAIKKEAGL